MNQPLRIMIDHVAEDDRYCADLCKHLAPLVRQNQISTWSSLSIDPGSDSESERSQNLEKADVVLLLVSPDYLAADNRRSTVHEQLLARHRTGQSSVVPVLVRPSSWHSTQFSHLSPLPADGRPVMSHRQADQGWGEVVNGVKRLLSKLSSRSGAVVPSSSSSKLAALAIDQTLHNGRPLLTQAATITAPRSSYDPSWYIPRLSFETEVLTVLSRPRAAVVIKAPDLVGKSWLLWHLVDRLRSSNKVAHLDLSVLPQERMATKAAFLSEVSLALLTTVKSEADASILVGQAFARPGGPEACLRFVLEQVLAALPNGHSLVLVLDSLDALIDKNYQNDVLGLLRGLLQALPGSPRDALRLLMAISTGRALCGHNIYQSTLLNISEMMPLPPFSHSELRLLCEKFGMLADETESLQFLVGGHPYLLHLGLHEALRGTCQ